MSQIRGASKTLSIPFKDLQKRKAWLGHIMENVDYTEEEEAHGVKMTERAKRARRANLNQYCFRIFKRTDYDAPWQRPQTIVRK